jgi:murein L,D-transpeptidase YcbB/YkuD
MRGGYLVAVLLCTAQALAVVGPACAEDPVGQAGSPPSLEPGLPAPTPAPVPTPAPEPAPVQPAAPSPQPVSPEPSAAPPDEPPLAEAAPPASPTDPVVAIIRSKLADPDLRKGANADDLAALDAIYGTRTGGPLWMTEMGFSAKGQQALFEIEKADDWGLEAASFELPLAAALPTTPDAQGLAEIKLDLAILKYARFARGGRLNPTELSDKLDQAPPVRDPKTVLTEIEAADAPDAYLQSLHPKHEQFGRLRQALLAARGKSEDAAKPGANERDIKRIIINMERWRWMPEDLGALYVWNNSPEFMLYVVKDGTTIYADKTLVGTLNYATPVFSADLKTIVFNPDWIAPPTVLVEDLLPHLRAGNYSILKSHKLSVSYSGNPVNVAKIDWGRVDIRNYTFTQKAGPTNVLGKVKFLYPNRHTVYMHDTLAYRKKVFKKPGRAIGHDCVRMEKPDRFAEVLLAEDKGWPASKVKELWDKGVNSPVGIDHKVPVHMVYFTAVVDETGKVATFADLYGFDNKLAKVLFGDATGFPQPPPEKKKSQGEEADASTATRRTAGGNDIANSLGGFLGD